MNEEVRSTDIQRRDNSQFQTDVEYLLREAEDIRLRFMRKHRKRYLTSTAVGVISVLIGAGGFGWFLLMKSNLAYAILSMVAAVILPALLGFWAHSPIKEYKNHHKKFFMPKMAQTLGGFKFHRARGISSKILAKTGIIPPHDRYEAEDCFMGRYKGVKVIFSEARLYHKKKGRDPVFDGIFVVLEAPEKIIDGHTIISADQNMVTQYASTRWGKLQMVPIETENPQWHRFQVFSDRPDAAALLITDQFQKELIEAASVFDEALMSAVIFREKFIFLAIPYEEDMFEESNMYVPITTKQHALQCKKEIDQLLEIIDIFDLHKDNSLDKISP